jgi:RNA polymerase sigma-70 factor (ECF subfamily)
MQIGCVLPDVATRHLGAAADEGSDEALIKSIARGDKRALKVLLARHNLRLYRFVLRLTQDESLAEDIVSELFFDVWRSAHQFRSNAKISTWLFAIARNKAMQALRRWRHEELCDDEAAGVADPADDPEFALNKKDHGVLLRKCLTELSPAHREVIDLVYYHEKSIVEVAEITEASENTVKTRMHYARKRLAKLLADQGIHTARP